MKDRDIAYDLMRFIGIMCIMIDHANPPGWLFQLRNFGTPLLIVTSALTYSSIYENKILESKSFLAKRLKRLILPTWMYLGTFFTIYYIISIVLKHDFPFKIHNILGAFSFYSGFRFIWIFKVYIVLAFITPIAFKFKNKCKSLNYYYLFIGSLYIIYEFLLHLSIQHLPAQLSSIINNTVFVIIPYSLLFLYGLRMRELSSMSMIITTIISFIIFVLMAYNHYQLEGSWVHTSVSKFPPTLYYFSYSITAINILLPISKFISKHGKPDAIIWLSSKSLWIYLWHITAYFIWFNIYGDKNNMNFMFFVVNSLFLLSFAIIATHLQSYLANKYLTNHRVSFYRGLAPLLQ